MCGGGPEPVNPAAAQRPVSDSDAAYRVRFCELAFAHPRWGWRKAHDTAVSKGLPVNPN